MSETVNVAAALVERARERPDAVALFASRPWDDFLSSHKGPQQTFCQLNDDSDRLARGLMKMGITRRMRTVLMVPPSRDFYALTFALFKVGAVVVLIDPGMGVKNLGICIAEAEPEAFVGVRKAHIARLILGWGRKTIRHRVTVGPRLFWGGWSVSRVRREGEGEGPILAPTTADETAAILFTSGSTGVAKGSVYTHSIFAAQLGYLKSLYGIEPGEVDLPTFPLFGLFGPALGMSASIPYMDFTRPGLASPQFIASGVRSAKVTNLFGSPALLRRVFFDKQTKPDDFKTLRRVLSAGAPVSANVIRKVVEKLPAGVQVHTPYGATEALPVATIGSDEILNETAALTAKGLGVCVGRVVPGMTARIIRVSDEPIPTWSDDLVLPQGEVGEIVVRGPVVTKTYYNRPDSTALHKIHDGGDVWHRMGDLGYLDAQGRLWFCGRKSHRVLTKHDTYYTICTEGVFNAHPQVFRTALVGVDRGQGIEPELCVEINPDLPRNQRPDRDASSRQRFLRELAELGTQSRHASAVKRFHVHRAFPVDIRHNAKIFREKLAVWAAKQSGGLVT